MMDRIPQEVLDRAHRALCRRIAATIVYAMAEADCGTQTVDVRLGWKEGATQKFLDKLIAGKSKSLKAISDVTFTLGCELHFQIKSLPEAEEQ